MSEAKSRGEILLFQGAEGAPALEVRLAQDTVWLSQAQMVELFQRDQSVVSRHLRNVFAEGELDSGRNMQKMHTAGSTKPTSFYNLDVIISVGYRVKSHRGTQFRIWATRVLREHLVRGYTVNAHRLRELKQAVRLVADVAERRDLSGDEAKAVLRVVSDYAYALDVLDVRCFARLRVDAGRGKFPAACTNRAPPKPPLLLSVMDLVAESSATDNSVELSPDLVEISSLCGAKVMRHRRGGRPHLPLRESRNDEPRNGLALCRLCHWTFDEVLLSPSTAHVILASPQLTADRNVPAHLGALMGRTPGIPRSAGRRESGA
jgi:hypothetical protein